MIRTSLVLALATLVAAAEPSAFKAGDFSSNEPYGFSEQEKQIYSNKQAIKSIEKDLFNLNQQVSKLTKMLDGINETIRSNNVAIKEMSSKLNALSEQMQKYDEREKKQEKEIEKLSKKDIEFEKEVNLAFAKQNQNQKKLSDQVTQIQKYLESSVAKDDYESVIEQLRQEIESNREAIIALGGKIKIVNTKSDDEILKEAKELIEARKYNEAKRNAQVLIERKNHLAEAHFLIGSSQYFQNDNKNAIASFKESTRIDENAKHMPILLFYTAIAFEREKEKAEAKKFYEAILNLYPEHKIAESAQKRLAKLK